MPHYGHKTKKITKHLRLILVISIRVRTNFLVKFGECVESLYFLLFAQRQVDKHDVLQEARCKQIVSLLDRYPRRFETRLSLYDTSVLIFTIVYYRVAVSDVNIIY